MKQAAGMERSMMDEKEKSAMNINWSWLYVLLPNEEDCGRETSGRVATEHHNMAQAEHSPQLQLLSLPNGPFNVLRCDIIHNWCHLSLTICTVYSEHLKFSPNFEHLDLQKCI